MKTEVGFLHAFGKKLLSWVGLADENQKMRENAANWIELAEKIYNFRRDVLPEKDLVELQARTASLKAQLKNRDDAAKLKLGIEALEPIMRQTGGAIYPKTALVENVEFFLVAAIVILGIRTYFVQPFKIPTNSMWPTYNGMTPQVFVKQSDEPGFAARALRFAAFGAFPRRVDAKTSGEVIIPLDTGARVPFHPVPGRNWFIFPTTEKEYTLLVGDSEVKVRVPMDFDFEWAVRDAFFPNAKPSHEPGSVDLAQAAIQQPPLFAQLGSDRFRVVRTGKQVKAGERVLSFDILTGDQLFVDRISYHFMRPNVGSGFVFRTGNIEGIARDYGDQYYIKRLVGVPGDTLEIKEHTLYRNGAPITGSEAFAKNFKQEGNYVGYRALGSLRPGSTVDIKKNEFFAMGDNSANSADGRYWGTVPAKDVVGRPIMVYYPFTNHWGPAK